MVVVAMLMGAFWWLDFRAATSESRAGREISAFRSGPPSAGQTGRPSSGTGVRPKLDLVICVFGQGDLGALREALLRQLHDSPIIGDIEVVAALPERSDGPVLGVEVGSERVLWTPIYATARLEVAVVYSSNGDLSWHGQRPVIMTGDGRPIVWMDGSLEVEDATRGVTSRRAYQKHLGEQVAREVSKTLDETLADHASTSG